MILCENGAYREMTEQEIASVLTPEYAMPETTDVNPLTEMAAAMSTATTLAQMRAAAKTFLDQTGGAVHE